MHAIVVHVTFKPGQEEAAARELDENVIPGVKRAEGFKSGYWLVSEDGKTGVSVELFESADDARAEMARRSTSMPAEAPLTIDTAGIFEVLNSA